MVGISKSRSAICANGNLLVRLNLNHFKNKHELLTIAGGSSHLGYWCSLYRGMTEWFDMRKRKYVILLCSNNNTLSENNRTLLCS